MQVDFDNRLPPGSLPLPWVEQKTFRKQFQGLHGLHRPQRLQRFQGSKGDVKIMGQRIILEYPNLTVQIVIEPIPRTTQATLLCAHRARRRTKCVNDCT